MMPKGQVHTTITMEVDIETSNYIITLVATTSDMALAAKAVNFLNDQFQSGRFLGTKGNSQEISRFDPTGMLADTPVAKSKN